MFCELSSLYLSPSALLSPMAKAKRRKHESVQQVLSNLLNGCREASQMHTHARLRSVWIFCNLIRVKVLTTVQGI